jgi:superfamily I DNA and RNA helicase
MVATQPQLNLHWRERLEQAVLQAQLTVVGSADVVNQAQAEVVMALLAVYGDQPAGAIYIEPCLRKSSRRPPDVVLCHRNIGVLVIEVKAFSINFIQKVQGGSLLIFRDGLPKEENPLRQAQMANFDIRDELKRHLGVDDLPLMSYLAAFPNITSGEWNGRGYDEMLPMQELLFGEHIGNPTRLEQRLKFLVSEGLQRTRLKEAMTSEQYKIVRRVFGDSAVLMDESRSMREDLPEKSWGAYIDQLHALDKHLSPEQQELSRQEIGTTPRLIRGVAGSGKTVVLANQVARLLNRAYTKPKHMFEEEPPLRLAVVCFNRSLVPFIRSRIETAYFQQTQEPLPEDLLLVTHLNGLAYALSAENGGPLTYLSMYQSERTQQYIVQLESLSAEHPDQYDAILFDAIFVDEGQDCMPEEYQLLLSLLRPHPSTGEKPLLIFYDDAQNIYARQRPNWSQIGVEVKGGRSRVMKQGFRNPREVIELGFNVLLGSQADPDLRVQTRTYADLDYLKKADLVTDLGDHIKINFAVRSNAYWKPRLHSFSSREEEKAWLVSEVQRLLNEEHVRPEDILILFHKKAQFQDLPDLLLAACPELEGILLPYDTNQKDRYIFAPSHLTLSTTHSAKGYDAPVVFVVGTDLFQLDNEGRASFYVGVTRAKLVLYLSGLDEAETLLQEAALVSTML